MVWYAEAAKSSAQRWSSIASSCGAILRFRRSGDQVEIILRQLITGANPPLVGRTIAPH